MMYYNDKNWHDFIKEYLKSFSKFAFQEIACPVRQLNIFWKFYLPADTLLSPKTVEYEVTPLIYLSSRCKKASICYELYLPNSQQGSAMPLLQSLLQVEILTCILQHSKTQF